MADGVEESRGVSSGFCRHRRAGMSALKRAAASSTETAEPYRSLRQTATACSTILPTVPAFERQFLT